MMRPSALDGDIPHAPPAQAMPSAPIRLGTRPSASGDPVHSCRRRQARDVDTALGTAPARAPPRRPSTCSPRRDLTVREASLAPAARIYLRERGRVDQERAGLGASLSTRWLDITAMNRLGQFNHRIRGFWGW
jgi:hypothetical protein